MSAITVGRWGHNLAVRLPREVVRAVGLHEGEQLEVAVEEAAIVIRRPVTPPTLEALFRGRSAKEWRAAYAGAFDWGPDLGREIVEP